jgi:hypothetical protein
MKVVINSILYFFGLGENPIEKTHKNDQDAIASDWINIGNDIRKAMNIYGNAE